MIDIQTDPIKHLKIKKKHSGTNISNILVLDSKYRTGFEIPAPANLINYYVRKLVLIKDN